MERRVHQTIQGASEEMNRLTLAILTSAIVMVVVLFVCDVWRTIETPLSPYGMTHWIPELLTIFLVGRWLVGRMKSGIILTIGFSLALYSMLTYTLLNQTTLGVGTGSVFLAIFLMGVWSANTKKGRIKS